MKRKFLLALLSLVCTLCCAFGLSACGLFGGDNDNDDDKNDKFAVYHLNGGYFGDDADEGEEYRYPLDDGTFFPMKAKKDTWVFENWYFDSGLTEVYSDSRFTELRASRNTVDLYAKYVDEVVITKDNFKEYFKVSSRWNGGGNIGNAAIRYSITPVMTFDPENSTKSIDVEINPVLTSNNEVVWDGGKSTVNLNPDNDYSIDGIKAIDSSGAGIKFDIIGRTLDYELKTLSFKMKFLHKVPVAITLDLDGGECDQETINATGSEYLLKSSLPTPTKSGYRFLGWYTDADFENEYEDWIVTHPRTLYAKFVREITVTYHMNGAAEKESKAYLSTEFVTAGEAPVREGYKFFGYYTTPDFKDGTKFSAHLACEEDIDLYARWEAIRTITFETNGGTQKKAIEIADTEIPFLGSNPIKNSLTFYGWYTDAACTKAYDEEKPISGDLTLYALWVQEKRLDDTTKIEDLTEYLDYKLTKEKTDGVLTLTLNLTVKEKYRKYGFVLTGNWRIDFTNEKGDNLGNDQFHPNDTTLSTLKGKYTTTATYTAEKGYANNDATVINLSVNSIYGAVYIPEGGFQN